MITYYVIINILFHIWLSRQDVGGVLQTPVIFDQQGEADQAGRLNCKQVSKILHLIKIQTLLQKQLLNKQKNSVACKHIDVQNQTQMELAQLLWPAWNAGDRDPRAVQRPQIHQGWTEL